jgi:hypothetical protein
MTIQVYALFPGCPSGASNSHNIIYYSPTAPLKKGNSQMDSSVQDNPAASSPCQYTLKVLSNSLLGQYSNTHFAKPFWNRHVASRAVSTSTGISSCFQPGRLKSCWALPPWLVYAVQEKGGNPERKPHPLPFDLRNPYRKLKSENSQDYAQKPQRKLCS